MEIDVDEPESPEIEIWNYAPELFAKKGIVDPLSLFLTLKNTEDERIEMVLDNLLRKIKW
jgi:hypothetical protein